jgi:hypothetical protein
MAIDGRSSWKVVNTFQKVHQYYDHDKHLVVVVAG